MSSTATPATPTEFQTTIEYDNTLAVVSREDTTRPDSHPTPFDGADVVAYPLPNGGGRIVVTATRQDLRDDLVAKELSELSESAAARDPGAGHGRAL